MIGNEVLKIDNKIVTSSHQPLTMNVIKYYNFENTISDLNSRRYPTDCYPTPINWDQGYYTTGVIGNCLIYSFVSNNSLSVWSTDSSCLSLFNSELDWSISCWIKPPIGGYMQTQHMEIFNISHNTTMDFWLTYRWDGLAPATLQFGGPFTYKDINVTNDGLWHHVIVRRSGIIYEMIWDHGTPKHEEVGSIQTESATIIGIGTNSRNLCSYNDEDNCIDELYFFNKYLSDYDIHYLYNSKIIY